MKSLAVSVFWPAWSWINHPESRFLFASYAQVLSIRDSVKCRRVIESPWYQSRWGDRFKLTGDQNTKTRFENDQNGYRLSTSVDGALTGEGGDIIVIDDPHNVREAESEAVRRSTLSWWDEAMTTRLNDPKTGAYVIVMQRVHESDLTGHILAREYDDWTHLCLPARFEPDHPTPTRSPLPTIDPRTYDGEPLWPERYGEAELAKLERSLGPYGSAGQLQQRPAPREGGMFKRIHFGEIRRAVPSEAIRVRYWDKAGTASGGDYTAGVLMAKDPDGTYWIEHIVRGQWSAHERNTIIKQTAEADRDRYPTAPPSIWIEEEPGSGGKESADISRRDLAGFSVRTERPTGSKEVRADPFSAQCEGENVRIVNSPDRPWDIEAFFHELEQFPNGRHDDQVDAASGAFMKLVKRSTELYVYSLSQ